MPGLHTQMTSTELTNGLHAAATLMKLEPYIDRLTFAKISTLRADFTAEQEDRDNARAEGIKAAKARADEAEADAKAVESVALRGTGSRPLQDSRCWRSRRRRRATSVAVPAHQSAGGLLTSLVLLIAG